MRVGHGRRASLGDAAKPVAEATYSRLLDTNSLVYYIT